MHTCSFCQHSFSQAGNLTVHINSIHLKTQTYPCTLCKNTFKCKSTLRNHTKYVHQDGKIKCADCGKKFVFHRDLVHHLEAVRNKCNPLNNGILFVNKKLSKRIKFSS